MENLTKQQRVNLIGKKCLASAVYVGRPAWERVDFPERPGWITGFGVIRRGESEYLGNEEGYGFVHEETISVAKVRFWTTETERNVPLDALIVDESAEPFPSRSMYSKSDKKMYEDYGGYPRDAKGRFIEE